jgi:HlyD family secretion protein
MGVVESVAQADPATVVDASAPRETKSDSAKAPDPKKRPVISKKGKIVLGAIALAVVAAAGALTWFWLQPEPIGPGFASGNGRLEGTEINVSPKIAGRLAQIFVNEGDFVKQGQVVAQMDTATLLAQRDQAQAELTQAVNVIAADESLVVARQADRAAAQAVVAQHKAASTVAEEQLGRSRILQAQGWTTGRQFDQDLSAEQSSDAAVATALAQVAAADSAIVTAQAQVVGARSAVVAAQAAIAVIQTNIDDSALRSPRDGRVQYRVAQLSEVIAAGGVALTIVDLTDVYMTFFLSDASAGKVAMGAQARLALDAAPEFVIPATISFVAAVAQFTPKTVETTSERENLMFRVRARIDPEILRKFITQVKTGLPGTAYVRLDASQPWPARLETRLPK